MVIPAENLAWDVDIYTFDIKLRMGPLHSDLVVSGTVSADGAIQGTFEPPAGGFRPFRGFEGTLGGRTTRASFASVERHDQGSGASALDPLLYLPTSAV